MLTWLIAAAAAIPAAETANLAADHDLRCAAAISVVAGASAGNLTPQQKASTTIAMVYYVGKVDGARPGLDYAEAFKAVAASADFRANFRDEALRCMQQESERARSLRETTRALQATGN